MNKQEKGVYLLIIKLEENKRITVGKQKNVDFKKGIYLYIGRASRGFRGRVNRHLRKDKKLFWHIDYFLQEAVVKEVWTKPGDLKECRAARKMKEFIKTPEFPLKKFGSSDCNCPSHLFYLPERHSHLEELWKHLSFRRIRINGNHI